MEGVSVSRRPPTRPVQVDDLSRHAKDKIRLGYEALPQAVDGRCSLAKRYREIAGQVLVDQGDDVSEIRLQLIRRFVGACVLAEKIEAAFVSGTEDPVKIDQYSTIISSLVRVASKIGLDRIPKNVTPSLKQYLDQKTVNGHDRDDDHREADE